MNVELLPAFQDNYLFAVPSRSGTTCFVVDPGDPAIIIAFLKATGLALEAILITHHHPDHIGGVSELLAATGCRRVIGPGYDARRIPHLSELVEDGDRITVGGYQASILYTPGHTMGHICYDFREEKVLFCGDTLFSAGCGRMFEGNQKQMWDSMKEIRSLPDDTHIYCAHEYTLANLKFARTIDGSNLALEKFQQHCESMRQGGLPTVPTTIGEQKKVNPFLRCDEVSLQTAMGMSGQDGAAVFGAVRSAKDHFRG